MRTRLLVAVAVVVLTGAAGLGALSIDAGPVGFGGIGMGSTDDKDTEASPGFAVGFGVAVDTWLVDLSSMTLGLSTGFEYEYLKYSADKVRDLGVPFGSQDYSTDTNYSYLTIPLTVAMSRATSRKLTLVAQLGGFVNFFQKGESDVDWDNPLIPDDTQDIEDQTESTDFGLRAAAGVNLPLGTGLLLAPRVLFDMGLKDITSEEPSTDRLWKLVAGVTLHYRVLK
jgi:hypothetical protein